MKSNPVMGLFAVLVLFSGCLYSDLSDDELVAEVSAAHTVVSDDGLVKLTVPSGVDPSDISVKKISPTEVIGDSEDTTGFFAYELLPDGKSFSQSVILEFSYNRPGEVSVPSILHFSGDKVESVEHATITFEEKRVYVKTELNHFSKLIFIANGQFSVDTVEESRTAYVGHSFPYTLVIKVKDGGIYEFETKEGDKYFHQVSPSKTWIVNIEGEIGTLDAINGILAPGRTVLPVKSLGFDEEYVFRHAFTCEKEGKEKILVSVPITYMEVSGFVGYRSMPSYKITRSVLYTDWYNCIKAPEGMELVNPPYLLDCGGGKVFTGTGKKQPDGSFIDDKTGKKIECP